MKESSKLDNVSLPNRNLLLFHKAQIFRTLQISRAAEVVSNYLFHVNFKSGLNLIMASMVQVDHTGFDCSIQIYKTGVPLTRPEQVLVFMR